MARTAATHDSPLSTDLPETRTVSHTLAQIRAVVRKLNQIAGRMDRTLGKRLRRLEGLRE